jgi:MFS family permease
VTLPASAACAASAPVTALEPLRNRAFAVLWSAWLVANICTWMCDVASAWVMTTLTESKAVVAMVQTATTLPAFLLALPGGAVADLVDRRRWLLTTQLWMAGTSALLAVTAFTGTLSPPVLLGLAFASGTGFALRWPVFSALVPEVVSRRELPQALALHALAVNASRIAGPVLAGVVLAAVGSVWVFTLSAVLSLVSTLMILRWHHASPPRQRDGHGLAHAMLAGVRYVVREPMLRAALVRAWVAFMALTAVMALLPLFARELGPGNAVLYTALYACLGAGAVAAALGMPRLRARMDSQRRVSAGLCVMAASIAVLAVSRSAWQAAPALVVAGATWLTIGNTLSVTAQLALPDGLRARGMSIFLMACMAGGAAGAAACGFAADAMGVHAALLALATLTLVLWACMRGRWLITPAGSQGAPAG